MKIGVVGAAGRMGRMHLAEILQSGNEITGALERVGGENVGKTVGNLLNEENINIKITDNPQEFVSNCHAVIDFSSPESTLNIAKLCAEFGVIHVIGTTGLNAVQEAELKNLSEKTRIVYAPNMSVGVNLLFHLVKEVASKLSAEDYDIDIVEMHHNQKVDAPSGTALGLGKAAAEGRAVAFDNVKKLSREGVTGKRPIGEIGFATLRGGDVVGDHTVIFAGDGDRIEITHKASNRKIYAKGAVRACVWAANQPVGLYSMKDVLGIK